MQNAMTLKNDSLPKGAKIMWCCQDTRWHVYPQRQRPQVAAHCWEGWYLPTPEGRWFKSPSSFHFGPEVTAEDTGVWVQDGALNHFRTEQDAEAIRDEELAQQRHYDEMRLKHARKYLPESEF
jgi:hypothetical protein